MSNKCKNLGAVVLILGIIGSCIMTIFIGRNTVVLSDWFFPIMFLVGSIISVYVIYVGLTALGEILENQEIIINSIVDMSDDENVNDDILHNGSWKCSCGRINPSYTGTCGCGNSRPT